MRGKPGVVLSGLRESICRLSGKQTGQDHILHVGRVWRHSVKNLSYDITVREVIQAIPEYT